VLTLYRFPFCHPLQIEQRPKRPCLGDLAYTEIDFFDVNSFFSSRRIAPTTLPQKIESKSAPLFFPLIVIPSNGREPSSGLKAPSTYLNGQVILPLLVFLFFFFF